MLLSVKFSLLFYGKDVVPLDVDLLKFGDTILERAQHLVRLKLGRDSLLSSRR